MSETDPRHGTEAGNEQHIRDGETPCDDCVDAKRRASRRRTKRKTMGHRYTVKLGPLADVVQTWRAAGATMGEIGLHVGVEGSQSFRLAHGDHDTEFRTATYLRIRTAAKTTPILSAGITRRLQGLAWMGYSARVIADDAGVHVDTILDAIETPQDFTITKTRTALVETYERLHMRLPDTSLRYQRASVTRARNNARKKGWLPPLAWDDIDLGTTFTAERGAHFDQAVVDRILAGDWALARKANVAEKDAVVDGWTGTKNELERLTGWNVARYGKAA